MPYPIIPVNENQAINMIYGKPTTPEEEMNSFSQLQSLFLGNAIVKEAHKPQFNDGAIKLLEEIDKNEDTLQSTVHGMQSGDNIKVCSVPTTISDNVLLGLKADGYVHGYGRSVVITDKGRELLKNHYLKTSNTFAQEKKFDYAKELKKFKDSKG